MESSLLMWRFFTFIMVTDCVTVLLLPSKEQLELSFLHLTVLQRNFSRATSAPNAHKTEEILSTSGHESTTPCSGIAISAHGITHSFLFGTEIDTSFSSLTAFCILSNKNKGRIEFCGLSPPNLRHATFKAITYEMGTLLNCECKTGFRRSRESAFMNCTGNAGHSAWENQCQCKMNSFRNTQKQATPKPEEQKERKTTEMQSQPRPTDQVNLGHCREPPPWEHEASKRIYHFVVGQTVHYECAQGFRAVQKGPATSTCKMICGKTRWTQPQLKCTSDEESPAIMDTPSGSEASCPFTTTGTTTDFQKYTDVSTTTEMFIFTIEYQIAVAGCILLLISIFLLSALTWQRRRKKSRSTI